MKLPDGFRAQGWFYFIIGPVLDLCWVGWDRVNLHRKLEGAQPGHWTQSSQRAIQHHRTSCSVRSGGAGRQLIARPLFWAGAVFALQDGQCSTTVFDLRLVTDLCCSGTGSGSANAHSSTICSQFMIAARRIATRRRTAHQCCHVVSNYIVYPSFCIFFHCCDCYCLSFPFCFLLNWFYANPQVLPLFPDSLPHPLGQGEGWATSTWF